MSYRIGVDIGGTFADFCALDETTGRLATLKVLSTPQEPGREVITGLAELGSRFGIQPAEIGYFTHGTTVGINSVIQRKGIRLCLFTTKFSVVNRQRRMPLRWITELMPTVVPCVK